MKLIDRIFGLTPEYKREKKLKKLLKFIDSHKNTKVYLAHLYPEWTTKGEDSILSLLGELIKRGDINEEPDGAYYVSGNITTHDEYALNKAYVMRIDNIYRLRYEKLMGKWTQDSQQELNDNIRRAELELKVYFDRGYKLPVDKLLERLKIRMDEASEGLFHMISYNSSGDPDKAYVIKGLSEIQKELITKMTEYNGIKK